MTPEDILRAIAGYQSEIDALDAEIASLQMYPGCDRQVCNANKRRYVLECEINRLNDQYRRAFAVTGE